MNHIKIVSPYEIQIPGEFTSLQALVASINTCSCYVAIQGDKTVLI